MKKLLADGLIALTAGYLLAHFLTLFYNHWYFAEHFWLKVGVLTPLFALPYGIALQTPWRRFWLGLGGFWLLMHLANLLSAKSLTLEPLHFVQVLDFEAALIWPSVIAVVIQALLLEFRAHRGEQRELKAVRRQLKMRRRLRRYDAMHKAEQTIALLLAAALSLSLLAAGAPGSCLAAEAEAAPAQTEAESAPDAGEPAAPGENAEASEPAAPMHDRHSEFSDPALMPRTDGAHKRAQQEPYAGEPEALNWGGVGKLVKTPEWPDAYQVPMHLRQRESFHIIIDNRQDGEIVVEVDGQQRVAGHVLAPVAKTNPAGFTASGWAEPGHIAATAVNAIHIKTNHDYTAGKAEIFSLVPKEFADFDVTQYKSYFNSSSTLFTDIAGGAEIFGGQCAPLVSSRVEVRTGGASNWLAMPLGYVPAAGDSLRITVERRKYQPEWIEFENRFGGLIWIKEIGLEAYPIGQVLKPVAGSGRFTGTQYAELGRIRANHPGVIDISTTKMGIIGGFQIIPRDHSMSSEMTNARLLTQWMVVGPLWALDESWEGTEPLFNDYLYPAFTPAMNPDGTVNEAIQGADAFLDRFTVRGRYSDSPDPAKYELLRESVERVDDGLKTLTHVRIYFPRPD
ncbi:hypothetical protein IT575_08975 [bacterium]|nr:hypothetical protein [bacterium]